MREILFRGKDLETGEWVYGYFTYCCSRYDDPEKESVADIIPVDVDRIYTGEYNCHQVHEVDINTVGQFTGLVDNNGTKIFEGDVLESDYRSNAQIHTIRLHVTDIRNFGKDTACSKIAKICTIVGNIYDNPELLEESKRCNDVKSN